MRGEKTVGQARIVLFRVLKTVGILTVVFVSLARADVIYLKNGRSIEGFVIEEKNDSVTVDIGFGKIGLKHAEIDRIVRADANQSSQLRQKWQEQDRQRAVRDQEEKVKQQHLPREIVIAKEAGGMVVEAVLNNKVKARLILDTGATLTTVNRNIIEQLGVDVDAIARKQKFTLADGSQQESKLFILDSLSVQGTEARNVEVSIMESKSPVAHLKDGLLGMSFLKNFNVKIDHKRNRLFLENIQ